VTIKDKVAAIKADLKLSKNERNRLITELLANTKE
jgi:hypothetical protein